MSPVGDMAYLCLRDLGWEVDIDWDGGIIAGSDTIPAAQVDQYFTDEQTCLDQAWAVFAVDGPEKARLYDAELATRDCLNVEGHDIPEPPSKQVYLDSYDTALWMAWSYVDVRPMSESNLRELNQRCPQPQWSAGSGG